MNYQIQEIRKDTFLVESQSQYEICSMFMRPQEFYESPFESIRGHYFSVEQYMDTYAFEYGGFTYLTDWCGFNLPGSVVKDFFETFAYDLTRKERVLFEMIKSMKPNLDGDFYIIGACKQRKNKITIAHEVAHAYWLMYPDYKKRMVELINKIPLDFYDKAHKSLILQGYSESVICDEIQAYLSTSSRKDLIRHFNLSVNSENIRIPSNIKKFYKEFDSAHK